MSALQKMLSIFLFRSMMLILCNKTYNVISASAESGTDLSALTVSSSRNMSPTGAAADSSVSGVRPSVTAAEVSVEPANAVLPARPAVTAASSAEDVASDSYHDSVSLANQWSSAQNDTPAAAVYNSSYFGAHQASPAFSQRPQRPLHDIVSSMQGSFHFLQESQIELESM